MKRVQRVVILGGGIAGLSCAYLLTDRPGWQEEYQITVYEQGWRLGGKGASGRNMAANARIEEHGLHVWHGFYENAFALIQRCYAELGRPAGAPLATWDQAFTPIHDSAVQEHLGDRWVTWPLHAPPHPGVPGDGTALPDLPQAFANLAEFVIATIKHLPREDHGMRLVLEATEELLAQALSLLQGELRNSSQPLPVWEERLLALVNDWTQWLQSAASHLATQDDAGRRLFVLLELAGTITRGILIDGVPTRGFTALDDQDLAEWLERHGASPLTISSALVRGIYQAAFAYPRGDTSQPGRLAAGTALRGFLRFLNYKGAPLYRMNAGMGDVVFAPLYQVLRRRGVRFRFFHRVTRLHLTADKQRIASIEMVRQAKLKGRHREYRPLIHVRGLPCWPSEPLLEQLDGPVTEDAGSLTLKVNREFDSVVLAIPIAALPVICDELIAQNPTWRRMVDRVATVPTLALQLWLEPDLAGLGWTLPGRLVGTYAEPFDTWMEMSHLLPRELWPEAGKAPGSLAYFCGPMPEPPADQSAEQLVKGWAVTWLEKHASHLWPRCTSPDGTGFNWQSLNAKEDAVGSERLQDQYWRANVDPSERYVLSLPGTTACRLAAHESGFANLVLAGDWVRTGLDAGCIEAAVMSGMQASRALCGYPRTIVGETDLAPA